MSRRKKVLIVAGCVLLCYLPMQAAGYYQTKKVQYGGANFYYNGLYQSIGTQMVMIDGVTYMPVKPLCETLGLTTNWDARTQTVSVSGNTSSSSVSGQVELQAKDYEIASLKKELEKYKSAQGIVTSTGSNSSSNSSYATSATTGTDILGSELTATRKVLEKEYSDYFEDIDFDFSLSLSSSKLKVTISYDTSSENKAFNNLSSRKVKDFIEKVCDTIRDYHEDIVIEGKIQYDSSTKTQYNFSYSKRNNISYGENSSYSDITRSEVISIVDDTTSVRINGYNGSISVSKVDATVSDSRERVTFGLYLSITDEIKTIWNQNTGTDYDTDLRSYLRSIARELSSETDYEILGEIYNSSGTLIASYDYDENEIVVYKIS